MTQQVLEPAITPRNAPAFLLDWELTMKCNLDCSYCVTGTYGGHDNSTQHPPLDECLQSLDFMYRYVDLYMAHKVPGLQKVILNVYGGEALHHPHIVEILKAARDKHTEGSYRWHLTITTTTNAILTPEKMVKIIPFIDQFTVSYHTENSDKQKNQFKENLLILREMKIPTKCVVLMHSEGEKFTDAEHMIQWLKDASIEVLPRQLDSSADDFNYDVKQIQWFDDLYRSKSSATVTPDIQATNSTTDLSDQGRACCGGRQLCENQDYKQRKFFVNNKFPDWSCSVNWFFLYVKQVNRQIFVNKDCKMNFAGEVGVIGMLDQSEQLLSDLERNLQDRTLPVIQCKKSRCLCGLCAPKAKTREEYDSIIVKYHPTYNTERSPT
jgi:pyruvate-formate lyase-activating enzyme